MKTTTTATTKNTRHTYSRALSSRDKLAISRGRARGRADEIRAPPPPPSPKGYVSVIQSKVVTDIGERSALVCGNIPAVVIARRVTLRRGHIIERVFFTRSRSDDFVKPRPPTSGFSPVQLVAAAAFFFFVSSTRNERAFTRANTGADSPRTHPENVGLIGSLNGTRR